MCNSDIVWTGWWLAANFVWRVVADVAAVADYSLLRTTARLLASGALTLAVPEDHRWARNRATLQQTRRMCGSL
ncbi:hypothetical protein HaLaN_24259 [Haematococcus lacustris]|uniref:Uncharacterized protein n=1 Tax=Haematococcus lacustris TaxID=44745 RepID=A0A6A0A353_HAELA|nr:hypothetical protein HaLaN_24259 [Haematococcus lacustris]